LFAEKHAILTRADRGQARCRDGMARMLCVSSTGRVEYTKGGVPGGARCLVVGLAEGDGCTETRPGLVTGGEEEKSRVRSATQRAMMQWLVEGGGGEEGGGGGGVKFARRSGGW
jgi:hypothetical protein